jgi:hypothetical protein
MLFLAFTCPQLDPNSGPIKLVLNYFEVMCLIHNYMNFHHLSNKARKYVVYKTENENNVTLYSFLMLLS